MCALVGFIYVKLSACQFAFGFAMNKSFQQWTSLNFHVFRLSRATDCDKTFAILHSSQCVMLPLIGLMYLNFMGDLM